ncbi:MAG: tetratricopeptide repeat protein [Armatimonadetes bacterium]|nr:tetratricopeptide repeat protein [Armatimonadota bacterium]
MNQYRIEVIIDHGHGFYEDGNYDRAIDLYVRALEMDVRNSEALEGLGQSYAALSNWEGAARAFEQFVEVEPACPFSHYLFGHALGALGRHDKALSELRRALSLGYRSGEIHSAIGYSLHMIGDIERALQSYVRALELDPDDTTTLFNYGKALVARGDYPAARRVLKQAVDVDPDDGQAWIALGEVYEDLAEWDLALLAYERAIDLDPASTDARCLAAHAHLMLDQLDEAENEYRRVVLQDNGDSDAWAGLGEVLVARERHHEALEAFRYALDINPVDPDALSGFVICCGSAGAFDDARCALDAAMDKDPNCPNLWHLLATIEAAAGIPERALKAYERAAHLSPGDAAAHAGIGWALVELGRDIARAEIHLLESVRLAPDWYYPCLLLGELFLHENDLHTATEWFVRARDLAPDEPDVCHILADPEIRELIENCVRPRPCGKKERTK